jgi:hypothetical protein
MLHIRQQSSREDINYLDSHDDLSEDRDELAA